MNIFNNRMNTLIIFYSLISLLFIFLTPSWANLYKKHNRPGVVFWHGDPNQKKVALTFDDGPNEPYTSQILEILMNKKVRATFFVLGENVDMFPETAKKIILEGHKIGNHSYSHPNMILETDPMVRHQILKAEDSIVKATGIKPYLFRPPFGDDDPLTFWQTEKLGYIVIKWSISSRDWERPGVDKIVNRVMANVHNGAIILMHDGNETHHGSDRSQTVAALPILIDDLKKEGYLLVTIPELLGFEEVNTEERK